VSIILSYKSDETLVDLLFKIILDWLSGFRGEKFEVVLKRFDILQIRSVNIGEAWELLIYHNVSVLIVHKAESPRLIVSYVKESPVQLLFRNFHRATFRTLFVLLASVSVLLVCGCQ
jgi:hypothetical protein